MKTVRALLIALTFGLAPLAGAPAAVGQVTAVDYQLATSAIMQAGTRAAKVKSITRVPSVGVVRLDFIVVPQFSSDLPDPAEYKIMARRNAAGIAKLQKALNANPVTRAALAKHGVDVDQVAGVQISSNGSLRLYIFAHWDVLR